MPGRLNRAHTPKDEKDGAQSLRLAGQCNAQGRFEAARLHCLAALKAEPENIEALRLLSEVQTTQRTWRQHPYAKNYRAERGVHMDYPRNIAI